MPDVVIAQPAVASTPAVYTIAGAQAFELLSVQASYDGSGAGGAFLPALQLVDPGGHVMATATATSVAAGGSAAVSWFPGVGVGASATPPATAGDYTFIEEQVVPSSGVQNTITFSAIPQTYRHLVMEVTLGHVAGPAGTSDNLDLTWNSGIVTYDYSQFSNYTRISFNNTQSAPAVNVGLCVPRVFLAGADNYGQLTFVFPYYSQSDRIASVTWAGAAGAASIFTGMGNAGFGGIGANGAITQLDLVTSPRTFAQDSKASLYGIT